jgi:hypothetical protein
MINFFTKSEDDSNDISFISNNSHLKEQEKKEQEKKEKKEKEKKKKKEKNIIIKDFLFKLDKLDPNCLILENDFCFEEILRTKLIQSKLRKFPSITLTHLDILKIPFPDVEQEDLLFKIYYKEEIHYKKFELYGKFEFKNFHIECKKREDILNFVNNKKFEKEMNQTNILKKKLVISQVNNNNLFLGINIKIIANGRYLITYNYAEKKC